MGSPAGVDGEKGADVLGRRRVAGVEPALEDEAALVRGAHGVSGRAGGRAGSCGGARREGKGREGRRVKRDRQTATPGARERDCYTAAVPGPDEEEVSRYTLLLPSVYKMLCRQPRMFGLHHAQGVGKKNLICVTRIRTIEPYTRI